MKLDIRLFKEIRKEVKACRKQGVTSNPCRFFGGMYNEQDIDVLVELLQDESALAQNPEDYNPADVVYPVREEEHSQFVSYEDGDADEVLLEREIEGYHLWIVLTHDNQAVLEALKQVPSEYKYLFEPIFGEDTLSQHEEEYMERN